MLDWRIWIAGWVAALVLAAGVNAMRAEPDPCTTYNEMRQIHIESNGEFGWPRGAIKGCENESK